MSASEPGDGNRRLGDFPFVFLSYDEPWADANWRELVGNQPHALRVHGVKGLDACHKAAADAVTGDWVVTIDADTRIDPRLLDATVPLYLMNGNLRLDWLSRNAVNGLWSGNGCVKLWPRALLQEMRSHEAAPPGAMSLDHDIGAIRPGRSAQVTMPERAAFTEPSLTAFHAFRAGLRETVFLRQMAEATALRSGLADWREDTAARRLIEIWCSIGRHAPNGHWLLYGARLGLLLPQLWPGWDPRMINDYGRIAELWHGQAMPRHARGRGWNWQSLDGDLRHLGQELVQGQGLAIIEFEPAHSRQLAALDVWSPSVTSSRLDGLGHRLSKSEQDGAPLREVLEIAAALDHPAAFDNLGMLCLKHGSAGADPARAAWLFGAAAALGNPHAPGHLAALAADPATAAAVAGVAPARLARDLPVLTQHGKNKTALRRALRQCDGPICLVLDQGVTPAPTFGTHVPDPAPALAGQIVGYLCVCPVTGLGRPRGLRLATPERLIQTPDAAADVILPVILGLLPAPTDPAQALAGGLAASQEDMPLVLATIGLDRPWGAYWVLGTLLALSGRKPDVTEIKRLARLGLEAILHQVDAAARVLSQQTGAEVPIWSAEESSALRRMLPPIPARHHWQNAATALAGLGPDMQHRSCMMAQAAIALWGRAPEAKRQTAT